MKADAAIGARTACPPDHSKLSTGLQLFDFSFGSPPHDLACDEALLESCESGTIQTPGIFRLWEPTASFVVLGYANRVSQEVKSEKVPIFRRCSGGGSVLQGPGCLNYSLVVSINMRPEFESVTQTNCFIMKRNAEAISSLIGEPIHVDGYTDLTWRDKKFSGNSQRRKHNWLLFHGSFLVQANFELMEEVLQLPARQPSYRKNRRHTEFLTCLPCAAAALKSALAAAWGAQTQFRAVPKADVDRLVREKYATAGWNLKW